MRNQFTGGPNMSTDAIDAPARPSRSAWMMIPPPPLFVAAFFAGLGLDRVVPLPLPAAAVGAARVAGLALLAFAALLIVGAVWLFVRHWTTIISHVTARTIVT